MLVEVAGDGVEVIAHRLPRLGGVVCRDRGEDPPVLGQRALPAVLRPGEREAREQQRRVNPLDEPAERTIARRGDERVMKDNVGLVEAFFRRPARNARCGLLHPTERRRRAFDTAFVRSRGRDARRLHLEDPPPLQVLGQNVTPRSLSSIAAGTSRSKTSHCPGSLIVAPFPCLTEITPRSSIARIVSRATPD